MSESVRRHLPPDLGLLSAITDREREVLELIGRGLSDAEIAARLNRSRRTAESHRSSLGKKFGVRSRVELARIAFETGLVKIDAAGTEEEIQLLREEVARGDAADKALRAIDAGLSAAVGDRFFESLVRHLAATFNTEVAVVGEFTGEPSSAVRTLAAWVQDNLADRFEFPIAGAPCEELATATTASISVITEVSFFTVPLLAATSARFYAGVPLIDSGGRANGVLFLLSRERIAADLQPECILRICASRASAELERRQAERALSKSERAYGNLFDHMLDGFAVHEIILDEGGMPIDYRFLSLNPAFETLTGLKAEDIVGKTVLEVLPGTEPHWIETYGRVALTGQPVRFEDYSQELDKHFEVYAFRPESGRFACVFQDITERRQTELALSESERRYADIFNTSNDAIIIHDAETGEILDVNDRMLELHRCTRDQALAMTPDDFSSGVEPYTRAQALDRLSRAIHEGPQIFPWHARSADGELFWTDVVLRSTVIGGKRRVLSTIRDTTDRKRSEEALRSSEERLRVLFAQAADAVWVHTPDGWFVQVNEQAGRSTGYTEQELLGLNVIDVDADITTPEAFHEFFQTVSPGHPATIESHHRRKDGLIFPVEITVARLDTPDGPRGLAIARDITERKQVEVKLKQSEERFRSLFENAPLGYQSLDEDGYIIEFNETWCRLLGYTKEEVRGRNFSEFIHPDFREHFKENFPKFKSMGYILGVEFEMIRKDGSEIIVAFDDKIGYHDDGSFKQTHCVLSDVTERKDAEEALKKSQERLKLAHEAAGMGMFDWDILHDRAVCNERYFRLFGLEPQERMLSEEDWLDMVHPDDRDRAREEVRRALEEEAPYDTEYRVVWPDGTPRWVASMAKIFRDERGLAVRMIGATADITERKRAEEALREREEMIRAMVETSREWIWTIDLQGRHTYTNPAIRDILGYEPEEIVGRGSLDLIHEDDRKKIQALLPRWIEDKAGWSNLLIRWRHKDGSYRFLESNAVPVFDAAGELTGFRGVDRDVTERMRVEDDVRRNEERFRNVYDTAPLAFVIWDMECRVVDWNDCAERTFGWSRDEVLGKNFFEFLIAEGARPRVEDVVEAIRHGEIESDIVNENLTKDDRILTCQWNNSVLYDGEGAPIGVISLGLDITERKRTEDALHEEKEFTDTALDAQADTFFLLEPASRKPLRWNHTFTRISGYSDEEIAEMPAPDSYYSTEDLERIELFMQQLLAEGAGTIELELICKDGRKVPTEYRVSVINDELGEPQYLISIGRDITERRRAEEVLLSQMKMQRLLLRELDHRVRNNLSSLLTLIDLSRARARSIDDFAAAIRSRTQAIATVHSMLSRHKWQGSDLKGILSQLIQPIHRTVVNFEGPDVHVPLVQAQAVGLITNELVTNSEKYGAMTADGGILNISWTATPSDDGGTHLKLDWEEVGGPPIERTPETGVGVSLIMNLAKSELRGSAELSYPRDGVHHTLHFLLAETGTAQFQALAGLEGR